MLYFDGRKIDENLQVLGNIYSVAGFMHYANALYLTTVIPLVFTGTGPCYMGLVDSRYDAGRPRPQDVRERVYSLRTWWGRCLFWDTALHSWSGEGCHTTANSTLNSTVCL